jgi:hypothetical protein
MLGWVGMASYFVTYLFILCDLLDYMVQEGTFVRETLPLQAGVVYSENCSKAWHAPIVDLSNDM